MNQRQGAKGQERRDFGSRAVPPPGHSPESANYPLPHLSPYPCAPCGWHFSRSAGATEEPEPSYRQIQRAFGAAATLIDHVCVNHRRRDIVVAQQFLNGPDVRPTLEEGGSEAVPNRV
jgi:hypothetical protein